MFKKYLPSDPYVQQIFAVNSDWRTIKETGWVVFCLIVSALAQGIEDYRSTFGSGYVVRPKIWGINRRRHW